MNFKAHTIGGMLSGVATMTVMEYGMTQPEGIVLLAGAAIGGLLPDIDHRGSYLGSRAKLASFVVGKTLGHRGATHSPLVMGVILGALYVAFGAKVMILPPLLLGLAAGILSHILLDSLTIGGVPLLYPIKKKKFSFLPLRTGGAGEDAVTFLMAGFAIFLLAKQMKG